jgi:hypothetical protein
MYAQIRQVALSKGLSSMRIIAFALLTLPIAAISSPTEKPRDESEQVRFQFVEVLEVTPQYVQVRCESCGPIPDLRFDGTKFRYRCDGQLYENWTAAALQTGRRIQVVDCSKVVVTKNRHPVFENKKHQ